MVPVFCHSLSSIGLLFFMHGIFIRGSLYFTALICVTWFLHLCGHSMQRSLCCLVKNYNPLIWSLRFYHFLCGANWFFSCDVNKYIMLIKEIVRYCFWLPSFNPPLIEAAYDHRGTFFAVGLSLYNMWFLCSPKQEKPNMQFCL